jgi:hypothetical protein
MSTRSYRCEVIADSSGQFVGNGLRFSTEQEAKNYAVDLSCRWTLVRESRVVESDETANYSFVDWKLKPVCARCGHALDEHERAEGPCNVKSDEEHCVCYSFVRG